MACVIPATTLANAITSPASLGIGVLLRKPAGLTTLLTGYAGGLFVNSIANIAWRKAVLETSNLGINALGYTTPLISLGWLFLLSEAEIARIDCLLAGAILIVAASL